MWNKDEVTYDSQNNGVDVNGNVTDGDACTDFVPIIIGVNYFIAVRSSACVCLQGECGVTSQHSHY
jgi:hypothetical protein